MSIFFAIQANNQAIYGIVSALIKFDVQQAIFIAFIIVGCLLVFLCFCGACIACKRMCPIQCLFAIILTLCTVILLALGIALIVATSLIADEMEKACGTDASSSDISQSFNELYTNADSFYCVASNGCVCYSTTIVGAGYTSTNSSSTVTNVQQCTSYLEAAYADYGISFDDISSLQEYLGYFGDIEEQFDCSGICTLQAKYYFSDINNGVPGKLCFDSIKDDLILGEVRGYGIGYTVAGIVCFLVWFVQYGLCCRKNLNGKQGQTKNF